MECRLQSNFGLKGRKKIMARPAETANINNPQAERRFDSKVIYAYIAGAILLLLVFLYVGSRLFSYGETTRPAANSTRTQEDDKRASP
jgi:hypothetical protein